MKHFLIFCMSSLFMLGIGFAQVKYQPPEGEWIYQYHGEGQESDPIYALDELWNHENGSDAWDESLIGEGNPGGIKAMEEEVSGYVTKFLRIQDPGNPTQYGISDPSNRKIFFGYSISQFDNIPNIDTFLDDGVTFSFRARIAVPKDGDIDDLHPGDGSGIVPWPETGDGYLLHNGGKGSFGLFQGSGSIISFCLATKTDHAYLDTTAQEGLIMNRAVGNVVNGSLPGSSVDWDGQPIDSTNAQTVNLLPLDPREWHEF
ncbi:hypothetical protein JXO59_01335 [candidate division KSB1 bacterium]|nr:hypothetical protein [candidate division KSB1 bacterium]